MGHWKNEGRREVLVREVLDEFSYTHPNLKVSFQFATDILAEKSQHAAGLYIAEMIRSGNLEWDVIWLDPMIYHYVAEELGDWEWGRRHLVDFSGDLTMESAHKPALVEGPEAHRFTGGVFPGPYVEGFFWSVWYNKEVAERVGLDVRETGMSAEDLVGYVGKVHAYNQQAGEPIAALVDYASSGATARLFYSLYLSAVHGEVDSADQSIVDAAQQRVLSVFEKMGGFGPPAPLLSTDSWIAAVQVLMEGRALFFCDASWCYTTLEKMDPVQLKNLRPAQIPEFADGYHHTVGGYISTWAVLKNASGRDAGIELMKFWSRPEIAEKWIRYTKSPTGLSGSLYNSQFGKDIYAEFQRRLVAEVGHSVQDPLMFFDRTAHDRMKVERSVLDKAKSMINDMDALRMRGK
jgi:ABC-type glycerol-3-phosphate transport system substrate-binding protein